MIPTPSAPQGGSQGKDVRQLMLMIVAGIVLLLVLVALLVFGGSTGGPGKAPPQEGDAPLPGQKIWTDVPTEDGGQAKAQIEYVPDPGDPDEKVEKAPSALKPFTEDPGWDEDVVDRDENLEPRAFYYLIHRVATLATEELAATSNRVDSTDLLVSPGALRGRRVRIQGTLIALREKDFEDNRSGIRTAYIGQMVDNHWKVLSFYILDLPPDVKQQDVIEVQGIFYKIWKYRNRENRDIESPLIIARTARRITKYPRGKPIEIFGIPLVLGDRNITGIELVVGALIVLMIPVLFFLIRAERKKFDLFKKTRIEKRKIAAKDSLKKPEPPAPQADGAPPAAPSETGPAAGDAPDPPPPEDPGAPPPEEPQGA